MIKFLFFLLVGIPAALTAQYKNIFDSSLINNTSDDFFCSNPAIDKIEVYERFNGLKTLYVYVKSFVHDSSLQKKKTSNYEYYDTDFLGDKYLFEKKYGKRKPIEYTSGIEDVKEQAFGLIQKY